MLAVAGATTRTSAACATPMCSMALSTLAGAPASASNISVMTFWPVSAAKVSGVTNSRALRVITTWTSSLSCWRRRTSSAALYAATPPDTPSTTRMMNALGPPALPFFFSALFRRCGRLVFEHALVELFHGHARRFVRTRLEQRGRPRHQLARALRCHYHVSEHAVRCVILYRHSIRCL